MATAARSIRREPLGEINTTPLIDVLLVLLVMLVLTLPIAPHALDIGLPQHTDGPRVDRVSNKLAITAGGAILWNGETVARGELPAIFARVKATQPEPETQFEPDALASYDLSANVLSDMKQAGLTKFGLVGSERYREFDRPQ